MDRKKRLSCMKQAFIKSLPILCSYMFLGIAYGILMQEAGYNWIYSAVTSIFVYTGAFQYALITFFSTGASILTIVLTALLMNSRQIFYAISYVDDFKKMKGRKLLSIHELTDESYAVGNTLERTDDEEQESKRRETMFFIELFSHAYWVIAAALGGLIGQIIPYDMTGIDFCMTALFVIIFVDQWEKASKRGKEIGKKLLVHMPAIIGLGISIICLLIFGEGGFMLPSLIITSALLIVINNIEKKEDKA